MRRLFNKENYLNILTAISLILMIILFIVSISYLTLLNNLSLYFLLMFMMIEIIAIIFTIIYNIDKVKWIKIVSLIINIFNCIVFLVLTLVLVKVNLLFNNMTINDSTVKQTGYVSYNNTSHSFENLSDLNNEDITIGVVKDTNSDFYGKSALKNINTNDVIYYDDDFELFKDLVSTDKLDAAIFTRYYRQAVKASSEIEYVKYLDEVSDLYNFNVEVNKEKEDLSSNTFNILLIGFSKDSEDEEVGLADAVMLASINLGTLQVDLTSISRSTNVKFACAGGIRGKINETILYGEDCLMGTVEDLLDVDIDYYVKVNFHAVVDIVDALDGIVVDNPVEFVGQTSSSNRGEYTVWVPGGDGVYLNGEQALAFSRERNSYENGDLQRQLNQQQVISRIIEKILDKRYIGKIFNVIEAAGNNIETNLSKKQILNLVNRVLMSKNSTGIILFSKLGIYNLQVVGDYVESYDYYARLNQYVYKLYPDSIIECKDKINDILQTDKENIIQGSYLDIDAQDVYVEEGQYVDGYNNIEILYEELPNYYPLLIGEDYTYAILWATQNNVDLTVELVPKNSLEYDTTKAGQIISQSVTQGQLVEENKECTIKAMQGNS